MDIIIDFEARLKALRFTSKPIKFLEDFFNAIKIPKSTFDKFYSQINGQIMPNNIYTISQRLSVLYTDNFNLAEILDDSIRTEKLTNIDKYLFIFNSKSVLYYSYIQKEYIICKESELYKYVELLLPLAGIAIPKAKLINKDLNIAEVLGSLFNELVLCNKSKSSDNRKYLLQLLFLAYADSLKGSNSTFKRFFDTLALDSRININQYNKNLIDYTSGKVKTKLNLPSFIGDLPKLKVDVFNETPDLNLNTKCLTLIRKLFQFDWTDVNSDTIGSLIYKFVESNNESIGLHYTASTNVLKLLNPLFLDDYYKRYSVINNDTNSLVELANEISLIKLFDPTSGPGCFLNIAYKELNNLLLTVQNRISELTNNEFKKYEIDLSNFYALINNEFGTKLTRIILAISKCQQLGQSATITDFENAYSSSQVKNTNPLHENWVEFCPNKNLTFIVGSPTFKGSKKLTPEEKKDMLISCSELNKVNVLDYSSAWLFKSAKYISNSKSKASLVLTNSLTQGEQVPALWPSVFDLGISINFAHTSFKWKNSLTQNTAVTVVIIGICQHNNSKCSLYDNGRTYETNLIGPYLTLGTSTYIERRKKPIVDWLPQMPKGNMPYDNGNLLISRAEYSRLITNEPKIKPFIKRIVGSEEFIQSIPRYCLWINDKNLNVALDIKEVANRISLVNKFRSSNSDKNVVKMASRSHQFRETRRTQIQSLVIPSVSSENRVYIPMGFIGPETIVSNLAFVIYDCNPWIMGLLQSKMHLIWIKTVCGKLETRIRYSSELGYNNFPVPKLNNEELAALNSVVMKILRIREKYSEISLGELYKDDIMPGDLRIVHQELDLLVDSFYRALPFENDLERISYLFQMFDKTIMS